MKFVKEYFLVCFENILMKRIVQEKDIDIDEVEEMREELKQMLDLPISLENKPTLN